MHPLTTLARLLGDLGRPEGVLDARGVVVLDEAGMVDTRRLAALLEQRSSGPSGARRKAEWKSSVES